VLRIGAWAVSLGLEMRMSEQGIRVGAPVYGGGFEAGPESWEPGVLPGELISRVELDGLRILEPSAERVVPGCVHFGACGGCQYQHAAYTAQVGLKVQILGGFLVDAGLAAPPIGVTTGSEWGYRNRIRVRLGRAADGRLSAGYNARGTNEFLAVRMCPIAAPVLWRAVEAMLRLGEQDAVCGRWMAAASAMEVFCSGDEMRVQARFFVEDAAAGLREQGSFNTLCERLLQEVPELAGVGAEVDPELNRRVRRKWAGVEWGAPGLNYEVGGRSYWVSRGAFFQVNRGLVERLVEMVCGEAGGKLAWDLFAGVGLFSRVLAERFDQVVAVEGADAAAVDLAASARGGKGVAGFRAVHSSTLDFLKMQGLQRERPELVVLDPPRAGLGTEGAELLARIGAERVVYVSCDPVTLARDLAVLTREVYAVESVDLVDMFPQTFHVETVVRLRRV
jgi:23S rRNA (uracil1939-C5)-methyltransferase